MGKDFDVARKAREDADRSFTIGGKEFVYRPAVAPEAIMSWTQFAGGADKEQAQLRAANANLAAAHAQMKASEAAGAHEVEIARVSADIAAKTATVADATAAVEEKTRDDLEWLSVIDETIAAILEPDYHEAWREVRNPELAHPLSLGDLQELMEWLVEQVVNRPTGKASGSSPSDASTETVSTDASSLPVEPVPTPST